MKTLEIVFGNSCYYTIKNSKLNCDNILVINTLFNIGDLSNVNKYIIKIPKELRYKRNYKIKEETKIIIDNIHKKNKIRIWTSHNDVYSYLIMLYVSNIIKKYNYELYIVYSDNYNKKYYSPAIMNEEELFNASKFEYKLSDDELISNYNTWNNLISENSDLRIIENGNVKSVSIDYYDKYIIESLKKIGKVKIMNLVGTMMEKVYLQDVMYVYLINRLIKNGKINLIVDNNARYFENYIEVKN